MTSDRRGTGRRPGPAMARGDVSGGQGFSTLSKAGRSQMHKGLCAPRGRNATRLARPGRAVRPGRGRPRRGAACKGVCLEAVSEPGGAAASPAPSPARPSPGRLAVSAGSETRPLLRAAVTRVASLQVPPRTRTPSPWTAPSSCCAAWKRAAWAPPTCARWAACGHCCCCATPTGCGAPWTRSRGAAPCRRVGGSLLGGRLGGVLWGPLCTMGVGTAAAGRGGAGRTPPRGLSGWFSDSRDQRTAAGRERGSCAPRRRASCPRTRTRQAGLCSSRVRGSVPSRGSPAGRAQAAAAAPSVGAWLWAGPLPAAASL